MITEAIILAGGLGTRLRSVVQDLPKPMAPIANRPFLEILIELYRRKGINHFILSLGYQASLVVDHFKNFYSDIKLSFVIEPQKLGTGGAIRLAAAQLETDYALVLNGDSFLDVDMAPVHVLTEKYHAPLIFGMQVQDCSRYGRIQHDDGLITAWQEKGCQGPGIINAGVYVITRHLLDHFPLYQPFSIEQDLFASLKRENGFRLVIADGYFIDIGVPEDYDRAQKELPRFLQRF